ncbi:MAG: hypothetical protein ACRD2A_00270 [Vicinamibacterales bacterium]
MSPDRSAHHVGVTDRAAPLTRRATLGLAAAIALGLIARVAFLDRIPGIDGDEAWYGVNVQVFLDGGTPFLSTGVGNPLNPFHSLPLLALSAMLEPSAVTLRLPAVLWGFVAVLLAYPLLAGSVGPRAAMITSVLLSLSPAAIGHSRFGWDPAATPLVCLLAVGFALANRPMAAAVSTLSAVVIHPANVFVVPIVLAAYAPTEFERFFALSDAFRRRLLAVAATLVAVVTLAVLWILDRLAETPSTPVPSIELVVQRALTPASWADLFLGVLRLFSGVSTVADMAGPIATQARMAPDLIVAIVLVASIAFGWRASGGKRGSTSAWLMGGIGVSLILFHIVAGPVMLQSGRERYGLFLLAPTFIVCARGLDRAAESRPVWARVGIMLLVVSFVGVMLGGYFYPYLARGGNARAGLRSGAVDPKIAALEFVVADSQPADVVSVIAEDWYAYWPLRYLAGGNQRVHVELMAGASAPGGLRPPGVPQPPYPHPPDKTYVVVFDSGAAWSRLRNEGRVPAFTAFDPAGRPILHVVSATNGPPSTSPPRSF